MRTKKTAKKQAANKAPARKKVMKKKAPRKKSAPKSLPKPAPRTWKTTRGAGAEPHTDDQPSFDETLDEATPHEHVEPRELSHERLRNRPEESVTPAPDEDLVDDVAADAEAMDGHEAEEDDA